MFCDSFECLTEKIPFPDYMFKLRRIVPYFPKHNLPLRSMIDIYYRKSMLLYCNVNLQTFIVCHNTFIVRRHTTQEFENIASSFQIRTIL